MCGILGQVSARNMLPDRLPLATLTHRGPDAQSAWLNGGNCALGHTRLAIIDLDPRANQPMTDPTQRYTIVFNGEIYNYIELARDYLADVNFSSSSDTEVILHLWARQGVDCLQHLRGMFAFAIWDEQEQSLWLARDRMGKKPIFYYHDSEGLAFASEINALRPLLRQSPTLNPLSIDLFLGYQFIPAPYSIYQNIHKLPAAHFGVWRNGNWSYERYWQLDFNPQYDIKAEEAIEQLDAEIREATRLRLRADVDVGVLLSGGVDSSVITAFAAQEHKHRIKTFSVGFENQAYNELPYAVQVAERYDTEHQSIILNEEAVEEIFFQAVHQYGEPFGDKSALPSMLVCREAARHVKVVLNGDGGDELLGGYSKYQLRHLQRLSAKLALPGYALSQYMNRPLRHLDPASKASTLMRKMQSGMSPLGQVLHFGTFIRPIEQSGLYQPDFLNTIQYARQEYENYLLGEIPLPKDPLNKLLCIDYRHYLAYDLLTKADIASMASSLEARSPLLDQNLMAFAATLPPHLKIHKGIGKYLLKQLGERYLPHDLLYRPKQGFSIPVADWISTRFAPHLQEMCASSNHPLWTYCQSSTVEQWLQQHLSGQQQNSARLWVLLVLGTWLQQCN